MRKPKTPLDNKHESDVVVMRKLLPICRNGGIVSRLENRERCRNRNYSLGRDSGQWKFKNLSIVAEYDTHGEMAQKLNSLAYLKKRSKVVEIVVAEDIVFALSQTGVCLAFDRITNSRLCFLNIAADEVIRSLFYNKNNRSIITVSVYREDNFSSLNCRTTALDYVRRGKPNDGFPLFQTESLKWPGFVEFDDVNGKVLTHSAINKIYKVWDLTNYHMLYSIPNENIQEIKISPGIMLVIYARSSSGGHVPLKILNIEDGSVLKEFRQLLHKSKKVDFIEQFNEKLLVKQEDEDLQIMDVRNTTIAQVNKTEFMTPSAFIFLYENQLFLTFRKRCVAVWNFKGELVTKFEDHSLAYPDTNTNNIYITSQQDIIISYCKNEKTQQGVINVSNILNGKSLARITTENDPLHENALRDATSLFYNEPRNEIYVGTKDGKVYVWSN